MTRAENATQVVGERARPTWKLAWPLVTVAVIGMVTLFLPPYDIRHGVETLLMFATFGLALGFLAVSIRRSVRTWVDPVAPFLGFVLIALALDLDGGAASGLAPLVALPIIWLAMMGTRRDVIASAFVTCAMFVVPIVVIGGPDYPASDWRRAVIWTAVAVFVAPAIQRVVRSLARETSKVRATNDALALSEARWRVLTDHLPDTTMVMIGEDLRIRLVAGAGAMRQGFHGKEGLLLSDVSNARNMTVLKELLAEAFLGREATGELFGSLTGAEHEIVATPLPPDDEGARAMLIGRDISRERARERELVQARERAERLFSDAPHGVVVLTKTGVIRQANDAMRSITGLGPGELEGKMLGALAQPGDPRFDRHLADVLSHRDLEEAQTEWAIRGASGDDVYVVLNSRVLREDDPDDDMVLVNVVDVSERRGYEQRLAYLADHDALTGLANRRRFDEVLTRHLDGCERYGPKGAVLLLDLDYFKEVNDTLGHRAGDDLIVSIAALIEGGVRVPDMVARLGGDEFAILLTEAGRDAAEVVACSIVDRVREYTATLDGTRRRVTASIGVVTVEAASGQAADLLALADMTMYDAKDAGRNRYVVLGDDAESQPRSGARLQWKGRIEQALEDNRFTLHLQPILDLSTGLIRSAEALLRLDDDDGLVLPARFLHVAERTGLMPAVDAWVVEHGISMLADLRRWMPEFTLEVNLSGLSIGDPNIEKVIGDSLDRYDVEPTALVLEITETAAVANVEMARQFAERVTSLGCKFALDDFGAGFGSFYYLKHLIFDYVKIDGEFVANCHRSAVDRTILRSIVSMAHDLGKKTVAEFVAEQAVLDVVRAEGVDFAQGYLIGEPLTYDDFVADLQVQGIAAKS